MNSEINQDSTSTGDQWLRSREVQTRLDDVLLGCDDGEIYVQHSDFEMLNFSDSKLLGSQFSSLKGFGLRTVCGDLVGLAHSNELTAAALARAIDAVQVTKRGSAGSWDVSPDRNHTSMYAGINPFDFISIDDKVETLQAIDACARGSDPRVQQVSISLSSGFSCIDILRTGGEAYQDRRPQVHLRVGVIMNNGQRVEAGSCGLGGRFGLDRLLSETSWRQQLDEAIRMATVNLDSQPAPSGRMSVVLGAGLPGVMVHEAVGHGLEGDAIHNSASVYAGKVGEQVAAPGITIVDNGAIDERRGSLTIDDEGTPTKENVLIEDGRLCGYMHDRLSARQMGVAPTGNGRRESYSLPTMPRMTNTYMKSGNYDPDEIISSVDDGIYATSFGGGQVDITSGDFVFECTEAYRIRNGKIEEPLRGATLIGNGPEAMKRVAMVGNNSELDAGIGNCAKAGQTIAVGVGQPTLRMDGITVGGTGR